MTEKAFYHKSFSETIKKKDYEVPIYHFIPLNYLLRIIKDKILVISQIIKWEDTYENFLSMIKFYLDETPVSIVSAPELIYGQCWTLNKETDALWRIYSTNKQSVRIKTTIKKLLGVSLCEKNHVRYSTILRKIGQVEYLTESQIYNWIKKRKKENILLGSSVIDSLFIKRKEFKHEKEVRLLINKSINEDEYSRGNFKSYLELEIDPNIFIEEITFDPRFSNEDFILYKKILGDLGFYNRINKSKLYEFKSITIK